MGSDLAMDPPSRPRYRVTWLRGDGYWNRLVVERTKGDEWYIEKKTSNLEFNDAGWAITYDVLLSEDSIDALEEFCKGRGIPLPERPSYF